MTDLISSVIPWLIGVIGVVFAMVASKGKKREVLKRKIAEVKSGAEKVRAEVAEETVKIIIKSEKLTNEKVKQARIKAETLRGRFTNGDFG